MSSDESHSSNFATQSSCKLSFVEDVSCDSGGDVKYGEKCGFVQGLWYFGRSSCHWRNIIHEEYYNCKTVREQEQQTLSARLSGET
jgi:hypothetical protein